MATLVIDSSVAVKWMVSEIHSSEARRILDEYQKGSVSFAAPDLIHAEFGNIIWKKQVLQGLDGAIAIAAIESFRSIEIDLVSTAELLDESFHLAVQHKRSVYDSLYLALSQRLSCPLVTADLKLVNAVKASFPNVIWLPSWS